MAAPLAFVLPAVGTWWLIGDLSSPSPPGTDLDYAFGPWPIEPWLENAVGMAAVMVTVAGMAVAIVAVLAGRLPGQWLALMVGLLVAGLVAGWAVRVLTAGGIGANIGAGMVLLVIAPLLGLGVLLAAGWALYLARHTHAMRAGRRTQAIASPDREAG